MKARVIKETVNTKRREAIYRLNEHVTSDSPIIIILKSEKGVLSVHGNTPFEKYINIKNVPPEIDMIRIKSEKHSGVIYTDSNTIIGRIFYKPSDLLNENLKDVFFNSVITTLANKGIVVEQSSHRELSNDLIFIEEKGNRKKFCGTLDDLKNHYFAFIITLKFDAEKVKNIYKLNTDKFRLVGKISNITEILGGLNEVNPKINENIIDEIISDMARTLNWDLENSCFSEKEEKYLM